MALALIGIGLLIIAVVIVLCVVWSRSVQPSVEPGTSGVPDEGGQPIGLRLPADEWANRERPVRWNVVATAALLLALGALAVFPDSMGAFLGLRDCGDALSFVCPGPRSEPAYGALGGAVVGLLGACLGGYKARPVWLGVGFVGQALGVLGEQFFL